MDCIPYINDLKIEIDVLETLKTNAKFKDISKIQEEIDKKQKLINICKENLSKLSNNKIEYKMYLYILEGLSPTEAVERIADENYLNDIKPSSTRSLWRNYKKMKKILKCQ